MKDKFLIIANYEELREICIDLRNIAERHPDLKHLHDKLIEIAKDLENRSHELVVEAYELKKREKENGEKENGEIHW